LQSIQSKKGLIFLVIIPAIAATLIAVEAYLYYASLQATLQADYIPLDYLRRLSTFQGFGQGHGFTDSDLVQFPSLRQAVQLADQFYNQENMGGLAIIHPSINEARQLIHRLDMSNPNGGDALIFYYHQNVNGTEVPEKAYNIHILISYNFKPFCLNPQSEC
jgi:hypothetical protein